MRRPYSWFQIFTFGSAVSAVLGGCAAHRASPKASPDLWCNERPVSGERIWPLPAPGGTAPAVGDTSAVARPRWLVVWATWCKPCLDELPRVELALQNARERGAEPELVMLSIDADASALAAFVRGGAPVFRRARVLRASSSDAFDAWVHRLGFDSSRMGLPMHVLTGSDGAATCVHTGALLPDEVGIPGKLLRP